MSLRNKSQTLPPLSQLTGPQSNELDCISKTFKEHLNAIGFKTNYHTIVKTKAGYTFRRLCSDCSKSIILKVNDSDKIATIVLNTECTQHQQA